MPVTPTELLDAAMELPIDAREVDRRSAASRSYYAAYHTCHPLAAREGLFVDSGGSHAEVIDALTRSRTSRLKSIGYKLMQCRNLRVIADYKIGSTFSVEEAETARRECRQICAMANACLSAAED